MLTRYVLYPFKVIDEEIELQCECFACEVETPIGIRAGFSYRCEQNILLGQCMELDCQAMCDGGTPELTLPPLEGEVIDPPSIPPGCSVDENDFVVCPDGPTPTVAPVQPITPPAPGPTPQPVRLPTPAPSSIVRTASSCNSLGTSPSFLITTVALVLMHLSR